MNLLGFGTTAEVNIVLDGQDQRRTTEMRIGDGKQRARLLVYHDGETVSGKVIVTLKRGGRMEHRGIRLELLGQIEMYYERQSPSEFLVMSKELARPGELTKKETEYEFTFNNVEKPHESYSGINVRLRYLLRVTITQRLSDIVCEQDFAVHTLAHYPDAVAGQPPVKMEVGIEDCLHIELEYARTRYHLRDVIVGKVYFLLVRIRLRYMEVQILRRETCNSLSNVLNETECVAKFELMDGAPVRGETIPLRLFLGGYELTPTLRDVDRKFSVRYFLNLVLIDEDDRRYFKQQEIVLFRKAERRRLVGQALRIDSSAPPLQHNNSVSSSNASAIARFDSAKGSVENSVSNSDNAQLDGSCSSKTICTSLKQNLKLRHKLRKLPKKRIRKCKMEAESAEKKPQTEK